VEASGLVLFYFGRRLSGACGVRQGGGCGEEWKWGLKLKARSVFCGNAVTH